MNRVINNPDLVVEDMLVGVHAAHADLLAPTDNPRVLRSVAAPTAGRVGIVTGGGSGHEPAFLGYVGEGLVDVVAIGEVFSSPTAKSFADAMRTANGGAGVACLYGNYAGDNMNVKMAMQMLESEGIRVRAVVANDDVASAPKGDEDKRRGVAGEILMWKVGGACAALGRTLDQVIAAAQKAIDNTRSVGIGLAPCTIAAVGKPNFEIKDGEMEVGIGHHGEPGTHVLPTQPAYQMADLMLDTVLPDLPFARGDRVAVLVSGLGATPMMEQYILYGRIAAVLKESGIEVAFRYVGNYFTSLEMQGITITVMKLDDELAGYMAYPCRSIGLSQGAFGGVAVHSAFAVIAASAPPSAAASSNAQAGPINWVSSTGTAPDTYPNAAETGQQRVATADAGGLVLELVEVIQRNRDYLSEIDGAIGDGDHGINMSKGFTQCGERLAAKPRPLSLTLSLDDLGIVLMENIGGSMGPLYGSFFLTLSRSLAGRASLGAVAFGEALTAAVAAVQGMGNAQIGDKTLMDTLIPARDAYQAALAKGQDFAPALDAMMGAARQGMESTRPLQARIGRAARLGERSIGALDAGATSCCLILESIGHSLQLRMI